MKVTNVLYFWGVWGVGMGTAAAGIYVHGTVLWAMACGLCTVCALYLGQTTALCGTILVSLLGTDKQLL